MHDYSLSHVPDADLLRELAAAVSRERAATAATLAHIAEVDARRLYVPAGYPSMHPYCVSELHLSEDAAYKRIQAARAARRFPALFAAIEKGALHLTAVVTLAPYLTDENVTELIGASTHRSTRQIEQLLVERFARPAPESPAAVVRAVLPAPPHPADPQVSTPVGGASPASADPGPVASSAQFVLQIRIGSRAYDKWLRVQALLSHAIPSGDAAEVFERALDSLVERCEARKFGATSRPRANTRPRPDTSARHIPAHVKRSVWQRDGGRCTFAGPTEQRCPARRLLEFDHIRPVARGGGSTPENLRIRCRTHNAHAAEQVFGIEHMESRKEAARRRAAKARRARPENVEPGRDDEVVAALRQLGCSAIEARRAVERTGSGPGGTLEERLRAALRSLRPPRGTTSTAIEHEAIVAAGP